MFSFFFTIIPQSKDTFFVLEQRYVFTSLDSLIKKLSISGHFCPLVDSLQSGDTVFIFIRKDRPLLITKIIIPEQKFKIAPMPFTTQNTNLLLKEIVLREANKGYPFAKASIDSIAITKDFQCHLYISIKKNAQYTFDALHTKSDFKYPSRILGHRLGIIKGRIYREDIVISLPKKLNEFTFFKLSDGPYLDFTPSRAVVTVFLKKRSFINFDGLVAGTVSQKKIIPTGNLTLKTHNVFNLADEMEFTYSALQERTSSLLIKGMIPFLLSDPYLFSLSLSWKIYRKDTFLQESTINPSLSISFPEKISISFLLEKITTSGFNPINEKSYTIQQTSPGFSIIYSLLDFVHNPQKGLYIDIYFLHGKRSISYFDEIISKNTSKSKFLGDMMFFVPYRKFFTFMINTKGGAIFQKDTLLLGEFFRLGGAYPPRNIPDESILAKFYFIITLEPRYLIDLFSHIGFFLDIGKFYTNNKDFMVASTGISSAFSYKSGIIKISTGTSFSSLTNWTSQNIRFNIGYAKIL